MLQQMMAVVWGGMMAGVLFYLWYVQRLFRYLEQHHPTTFAELGSPHLFRNNTPRHSLLLLPFLVQKEYESLRDGALNRLAGVTRAAFLVDIGLFAIMTLLFVLLMLEGSSPR